MDKQNRTFRPGEGFCLDLTETLYMLFTLVGLPVSRF
jgi:hypothetical protein